MSSFFKKQKGIVLLEYINRTRVSKAKNLIKNNNFTVKDIALKVDYYYSNSFIRVFKNYEGITPGN